MIILNQIGTNDRSSNLFFDNCSWIRITFSVPRMMKYPPGSIGHSFSWAISADVFPAKIQLELRSIIGILWKERYRSMSHLQYRPVFLLIFLCESTCRMLARVSTYLPAGYKRQAELFFSLIYFVIISAINAKSCENHF